MFLCDETMWGCCLLLATFAHAAAASERYTCPEGWLLKQASCYRWGTTQVTYSQATFQCKEWGAGLRVINSEQENALFSGSGSNSGTQYWLGIDRNNGNSWRVTDHLGQSQSPVYTAFSSEIYYYNTLNCAVWSSTETSWSKVQCGSSYHFICQKPADCAQNMFGDNCSSECHCKGEPCDPASGICKHGCLLGWSGQSCDTEKLKAEAKFYCFKINGVNEMVFRTNQRNTTYRSVSAVDKGGNSTCDQTIFDHFKAGGMATLKVRKDGNRYKPKCGETMHSNNVMSWRFKFQEFPVTSSAYDVLFEVTCDFTKADTLQRRITTEGERPPNQTTTLAESKLSVSFDVIDPYKLVPVTTATLGQQVQLQMKLNNEVEYGISAIAPFNCSVSTPDDRYHVLVSDENGCMTDNAQIQFPATDLLTWRSDLFETFAFPGYDKLLFRCQFHVCFDEEHPICHDMCTHSKKRKVKKMRKRKRSHRRSHLQQVEIGTTLSVLN